MDDTSGTSEVVETVGGVVAVVGVVGWGVVIYNLWDGSPTILGFTAGPSESSRDRTFFLNFICLTCLG